MSDHPTLADLDAAARSATGTSGPTTAGHRDAQGARLEPLEALMDDAVPRPDPVRRGLDLPPPASERRRRRASCARSPR